MGKDWYEELNGSWQKAGRWIHFCRDRGKYDKILGYVIEKREEYWGRTGKAKNWAGSTEVVALCRALNRSGMMFGFDNIETPEGVSVD